MKVLAHPGYLVPILLIVSFIVVLVVRARRRQRIDLPDTLRAKLLKANKILTRTF
jgi:hypothetical protein